MLEDRKNIGAAVVFIVLALYFGISSVTELKLGTAARMGPGYFPMLVSIVLFILGVAIAAQSLKRVPSRLGKVPWRALPLILGAPVIFGLTVRPLGLGPALFITLVISAFASRHSTLRTAVLTSLVLTIGCVVVFVWGLGLPMRPLGTLFTGH